MAKNVECDAQHDRYGQKECGRKFKRRFFITMDLKYYILAFVWGMKVGKSEARQAISSATAELQSFPNKKQE
jgi:hypothetical protein